MSKPKSGFTPKQLCALMGKKVRAKAACAGMRVVTGWFVGSTYRRKVDVYYDEDGRRAEYVPGTSRHVLLVRPWPTMKTIDVLPSSIEVLPDDYEIKNPDWLPHYRKNQAKFMRDWPRDKKGRFQSRWKCYDPFCRMNTHTVNKEYCLSCKKKLKQRELEK